LVVSPGAKAYATHRLRLPAAEGRRLDRVRAQREEGVRGGTDQRGLSGGHARSARAHLYPLTWGWVAFWVLERERHTPGLRRDHLKRQLSGQGRSRVLPALQPLRGVA
jgi:hypothetical protein